LVATVFGADLPRGCPQKGGPSKGEKVGAKPRNVEILGKKRKITKDPWS